MQYVPEQHKKKISLSIVLLSAATLTVSLIDPILTDITYRLLLCSLLPTDSHGEPPRPLMHSTLREESSDLPLVSSSSFPSSSDGHGGLLEETPKDGPPTCTLSSSSLLLVSSYTSPSKHLRLEVHRSFRKHLANFALL